MDIRTLALQPELNELTLLMAIAEKSSETLEFLRKCRLYHNTFGEGSLTSYSFADIKGLIVWIRFDNIQCNEEIKFSVQDFSQNTFTLLSYPEYPEGIKKALEDLHLLIHSEQLKINAKKYVEEKEVKKKLLKEEEEMKRRLLKKEEEKVDQARRIELEKQERKEQQEKVEFNCLKEKFGILRSSETSPASRLYVLLLKMESKEIFVPEDMDWLKKEGYFELLAQYSMRCYENDPSDVWALISAVSYWRKAGQPGRAIEISDSVKIPNRKSMAALLTSRGGAFRDVKDFSFATLCAKEAIELDPGSHYPHNLLGAILFQSGSPEEAEKHFEIAIELGSNSREVDNQIRASVELAESEQQKIVARYLLVKDPVKYKWAEFYLNQN